MMKGQPERKGWVNPEVVQQDKWWWDIDGVRHNLNTITREYALNILQFCDQHKLLRHMFPFSPLSDKLRAVILDTDDAYAQGYEDGYGDGWTNCWDSAYEEGQ